MSTTIRKSLDDQLLDGLEKWCKLHPDATHWDIDDVSEWLVENERFDLGRRFMRKEIAKKLAKAQNRKRIRNQQGNRVRVYHAARLPAPAAPGKKTQKTFWAHRLKMEASFAHASFDQRQKQAEGFCRSMSNDAKDVNANNPKLKGNPIQLELNFGYVDKQKKAQRVQTIPLDYGKKLTKKKPH
jgi:hypothetical protein